MAGQQDEFRTRDARQTPAGSSPLAGQRVESQLKPPSTADDTTEMIEPSVPADAKRMTLRRSGACHRCEAAIPAGTAGAWHAATRTTWCAQCCETPASTSPTQLAILDPTSLPTAPQIPAATSVPVVPQQSSAGRAGGSALREYERRSAAREQRIRTRHPRLGGLLLALAAEPAHQRAWATGGSGERAVAAKLEALDDPRLLLLHDRKMRKEDGRLSKANIDHLVVAPSGVWVIDAKQYQGSLEVRRAGGLFSPRTEQLWIAGRNKTALVDGVIGQVQAVRRELDAVGAHGVPVRAAMCFIGTELPWFGSLSISDIGLVGRRGLAKLVRQDGPLGDAERGSVHQWLATRFPAA